ncbi:MAG: tandem-95 repeat protein, partial [bacterium]|nr:tandem-95 repeat protein [bacterium]
HDGSETIGDSFSYTIDDASGATSNVASVTVTVTPQNDAPTAANDSASVNEGASVVIDLSGNDTDPDNALDLSSIVITSAPANGTLVDNGDGTLTYTHDGSETVGDSFSYTIDDVSGTTSNVAAVTLTINPINDSPTAVANAASVDEGASVVIDLAGNDTDPDDGLDLTSIVITSAPANGSLVDNGDGTLTYTHDGSETVGDSFSYTIDDVSGATSNVASVTVTVNPLSDPPTSVNDSATVDEGSSVVVDLAGNDTDPDDALDLTSIVITSAPANGSLVDNGDGTFTYTHDGSETVGDSFSYTIDDVSGATSNVAAVTLTINPINDAPTAVANAASVDEGAAVIINLTGNDTDPDNALDLASIVITSAPANGSLVDNGDGTLTYTHDGSETVGDSFSYTIDDVSGAT